MGKHQHQWNVAKRVLTVALACLLLLAAPVGVQATDFFTDDGSSVHQVDINALAEAGITKGCNPPDNDLYCPDANVTRGQMAAFLVRALKLPDTTNDYFSDDDGNIFESNINALAEAGITKGCNPPANDLYCPDGNVTRAQMASFLVRGLHLSTTPMISVSDAQEAAGVAFGTPTDEALSRLTVQFGDPTLDTDGACPYFGDTNTRYVDWGSLSVAFRLGTDTLVGWRYKLGTDGKPLAGGPTPEQFEFPFPYTFGDIIGDVDTATGAPSTTVATGLDFFLLQFDAFALEAPGFVIDATAEIDGVQQGFGYSCD